MRVIIQNNYFDLSKWVSLYIKNKINSFYEKYPGKNFILGLPTGSTPLSVYKFLIEYYNNGELSFKNVITFNMDEYVGIGIDNDQSYKYFMYHNFFNHIDIPDNNINILNGLASDLELECSLYEEKIKSYGGIDLFLCGIGQDGHIAFNEPGSSLQSLTRIKTLAEDTIIANSRFFKDYSSVPRQALTVGVKTVTDAKEIIIMAAGLQKSNAIRECIEGGISSMYTCTVAQNHPKSIVACDDLATSDLKVKTYNYYKSLQNNINLDGTPIDNKFANSVGVNDKVVILSPHPDDDVIGMGGTMELFPNKKNVKIIYMTNGDGSLPDTEKGTRIKEALSSIKILGYERENIIEANLPFYENSKRNVTKKDFTKLRKILQTEKPNHIFICIDRDPNGTHQKCFDIFNELNKNNYQDLKGLNKIWYFMGAWGKLGEDDPGKKFKPNCFVNLSNEVFLKKILSIKMHISQSPPVITNDDQRDFVQRAIDNNLVKNNINCYQEEFFYFTL